MRSKRNRRKTPSSDNCRKTKRQNSRPSFCQPDTTGIRPKDIAFVEQQSATLSHDGWIFNPNPVSANLIPREPARKTLYLSSSSLLRSATIDGFLMPPNSCQLDTVGIRSKDTALDEQQSTTLAVDGVTIMSNSLQHQLNPMRAARWFAYVSFSIYLYSRLTETAPKARTGFSCAR